MIRERGPENANHAARQRELAARQREVAAQQRQYADRQCGVVTSKSEFIRLPSHWPRSALNLQVSDDRWQAGGPGVRSPAQQRFGAGYGPQMREAALGDLAGLA